MGKERCSTREDGGKWDALRWKRRGCRKSQYMLHVPRRSASIVPANRSQAAGLKQGCDIQIRFPQSKHGFNEIFLVRMDTTRRPGLRSWPDPKQSSAFMCVQHFLEAEINQGSQQNIIHLIRKWGFKWFHCGGATQFHCCVQHYFCPLVDTICLRDWNISKLFRILSDLCVLDILAPVFLGGLGTFHIPEIHFLNQHTLRTPINFQQVFLSFHWEQ